MAELNASFWGENFYGHPPLTDGLIAHCEAALGMKLPSEYVELLRIQNGGFTAGFAFPTQSPTSWAEDHVPLEELNGILIGDSLQSAQNLLDNAYLVQEWGLPPNQVLISGDGHTWISLDYRAGDPPSVVWLDVECGEELLLAESFAEFIAKLVPASEFDTDDD